MEQDTSVSSRGSINLDAKPKKSILKRSEPEADEAAGGDGTGAAAETRKRHVPFSRVIPELSRLEEEEEDARLGGAGADRGTSDLQSVSSAASLSPLSSDEQLGGSEVTRARDSPGPRYSGYVPPLSRDNSRDRGHRRRRPNNNRRRGSRNRPRLPEPLLDVEPLSPPRASYSPLPLALGSLSPHLLSMEDRSPSPLRLVRYSPSPERGLRGRRSRSPMRRSRSPMRRSRSPMRRSRSPMRRSPVRRSRRSPSRSPPRRSRSPGRRRRGPSPARYGRSPGRRGWSRSPSPRRRRSRSRSRSPPWGRSVERSLLAMSRSQGAAPAGYGPPQPLPPPPPQQAGMPGYSPAAYAAPGLPHPAFIPQPMPYSNPPRPPLQNMAPGANAPFGQPIYASPGMAVYPQPQPQPPPGVSVPAVGSAGISELIDSDTFLREVGWRKQQRGPQQQRQLTDVQQQQQQRGTVSPSAGTPTLQRLSGDTSESSAELAEIQKKRPWMTQQLLDLRVEMEKCRKDKNKKNLKNLTRQWHRLVYEAKQQKGLLQSTDAVKQIKEGGQLVALSTDTVERLTDQQIEYVTRRDRLAGELHQLKLEQKELDTGTLVMKKGKPSSNRQLHENLKRQGELLKALESVSSVVAQLKQLLDPSTDGNINGVGAALLKAAREDTSEGGDSSSKSEVSYLLLGDETLSAVQVYVREQETRASFGTGLPAERIRLVSRPDAALGSVEFRHWVRAAVRQSAAGTLVLLASASCLQPASGSGAWSAAAAVAPLLPLLRDLRADGLTRAVVVGVPTKPGAGATDRAVQFNKALQEQLEAAGPHVPRVIYTPIKGGPQDGFGGQTEGGLTLDLYRTLLQVISKCEQKPAIPGALQPGDGEERRQLESVQDASDTLQGLLAGLGGRLAVDEAADLGAVAALLDKLKSQGDGTDQLQLKKEAEEQDLSAEDPAVFFRDPADHVCLHCKQIFLNAKTYLEHLKSPEHMKQYLTSQQSAPEAPWRKAIPPIEKKSKNAESKPIKGLDMFIRVDCWYCKACELFVGDLRCASSHLKSRRHNIKYDEYLESNPGYHAVVGETRSRLLLECAEREEERTRRRRREEAQRRGDQMNERMRRQSETGVQDVTDEAAAAGPATTPPAVAGKKAGIKLNLLASASQPPEELGQLKKKVQANIAAEQEAKRLKEEEAAEKEAREAAEREKEREAKREAEKKEEEKKKAAQKLAPTVSNQPGAAAAAKVKITLTDKAPPQQPAASGAVVKKKAMPIVGKLPRLRQKKPEKPAAEPPSAEPPAAGRPLSKSEEATLALANRKEVLASIPSPADPPPEPLTEAISDDEAPGDLGDPVDVLDLMDIDLPDADVGRRADADELKMLGICDEDVAAQKLPATRPPP